MLQEYFDVQRNIVLFFFVDTIKFYIARVVIKMHEIAVNWMNTILSYYYPLFPKVNLNW